MSLLKKIGMKKKRDDQIFVPPLIDRDTELPPMAPPDNRIMRDEGIGGYLSPRQISAFVNPPSPDNSAGQQNMTDLMKQQQDTFGARFIYPDPPEETPPPGGGDDGGGDDGGGDDGGGDDGGGGDIFDPPEDGDEPPYETPIDPPYTPPYTPPYDPPYGPPGTPGRLPPGDYPIDLPPGKRPPIPPPLPPEVGGGATPQVIVYGPDGTMYPNPGAALAAGVTNYTFTPPNSGIGGLPPMPPGIGLPEIGLPPEREPGLPPMAPPPVPPQDGIYPPGPPMAPPPPAPPMAPPPAPPMAPPMAPPPMAPPMAPPSFSRLPVEMPPTFEEARYDDIMKGMEDMEKGIGNLKGVDKDIISNDLLKEINNPDSGGGVGFLPGMNLPVPRRATGMETLVSPRMMRRGR